MDVASYVATGYSLNVHDLWRRNFIILVGWFLFYQIAQVIPIEYLNMSLSRTSSVLTEPIPLLGFKRKNGCRNLQEGEPKDQGIEQDPQGTTGYPREDPRC